MTKVNFKQCSCTDCASACEVKPGWFKPNEIAPLAKKMGLTVKELFDQHLAVDWYDADQTKPIFVLSPRITTMKPGTVFPGNPCGVCAWLENGLCKIHTLGKPYECKKLTHDASNADCEKNHKACADAWNTPKNQKLIRDLLGKAPRRKKYTSKSKLHDIMGW